MYIIALVTLLSLLLGLYMFTASCYSFYLLFYYVSHRLGLLFTRLISLCVVRRTAQS